MVYCVSLLGVTGGRNEMSTSLPDFVKRARKFIKKPLAVGFGISTREHFVEVSKLGVDAVVVGSTIIKTLANTKGKSIHNCLWALLVTLK